MKIDLASFKGNLPRVADHLLPADFGTSAINSRLIGGELEAWKNFALKESLCKSAPINTIYYLAGQYWLHWADSELGSGAVEVDVAKSTIAGDTTNRVYLTGLDAPRYTNVALATTGSGCMPVTTRLLGVIAPDAAPTVLATLAASPAIDVSDDLESDPASWNFVPIIDLAGVQYRIARRLSTGGNPNGCMEISSVADSVGAYAWRDFGIGQSGTISIGFDILVVEKLTTGERNFSIAVMCDSSGAGPRFGWGSNGPGVWQANYYTGTSFAPGGASILSSTALAGIPDVGEGWHRVTITGTRRANGNYDFRFLVERGSANTVIDITYQNVATGGGWCSPGLVDTLEPSKNFMKVLLDNFSVQGSAPVDDTSDNVATSYVYTFVNDLGEESAPSPASATIFKDDGTTVTITTPTAPPTGPDYNVVAKRIYRAASGAAGTAFIFVVEIAIGTANYDDTLTDAQIAVNDPLESDDWDLPPSDLRGIIALPNDIMAGFRRNQLCLSAQGHPHAWPVDFRLATDFDVVGIAAIDTLVVVVTEGSPYVYGGNSPDSYSGGHIEIPQGGSSKRSIATAKGIGVLYASPDGIVAVAGPGRAALVTEHIFTRDEWQALNPSSMIATVHDGRYFCFYDNGAQGGFMLELSPSGWGKVDLAFHASAVYSDLLTDALYLVLDDNTPPAPASSPVTLQVTPNDKTVYEFNAYNGGSPTLSAKLPQSWLSRVELLPYPVTWRYCQVHADSYDDLSLVLYDRGQSYYSTEIVNGDMFVLPDMPNADGATRFQFQLIGTDTVKRFQIAESSEEIR